MRVDLDDVARTNRHAGRVIQRVRLVVEAVDDVDLLEVGVPHCILLALVGGDHDVELAPSHAAQSLQHSACDTTVLCLDLPYMAYRRNSDIRRECSR